MSPLNFVCICFSPCHDWRGFFLCGSFSNNCCGRKKETNVSYSSVPLFLQVVDYTIYFIYLKTLIAFVFFCLIYQIFIFNSQKKQPRWKLWATPKLRTSCWWRGFHFRWSEVWPFKVPPQQHPRPVRGDYIYRHRRCCWPIRTMHGKHQ